MADLKEAYLAKEKFLLVDVRMPSEYACGHIVGSINLPLGSVKDGLNKLGVDKNNRIVVYCRSGHRAGIVQNDLIKNGYRNVENAGGILDADESLIIK